MIYDDDNDDNDDDDDDDDDDDKLFLWNDWAMKDVELFFLPRPLPKILIIAI